MAPWITPMPTTKKNAYKRYGRHVEHEEIYADRCRCQKSLHPWGGRNRLLFDNGKESFHILHKIWPSEMGFKILGVTFDNQLKMHSAVSALATQGGWRLKVLLRAKRFFDRDQLITLFKSQILSYIESGLVAFVHAPVNAMSPVDRILRRFLREIEVPNVETTVRYNLAPLPVRKQISALGIIQKRVLGLCVDSMLLLPPFSQDSHRACSARLGVRFHSKQLVDRAAGRATEVVRSTLCWGGV